MEHQLFEDGQKYPFEKMNVGDYFVMNWRYKASKSIRKYAYQVGIKLGMKFSCSKTIYGMTVTRVE